MTEFRSAIGIELYNANAKIQVCGADESAFHKIGFGQFKLDSDYYCNEEGVKNISTATGYLPHAVRAFLAGLESLKIHKPFSFYPEELNSGKVTDIFIKVVTSSLAEIKVHVANKDSSDVHIHEFVYSGSFAIEWDTWSDEE